MSQDIELTGGDGIPRERGDRFPTVNLLRLGNEAYLKGRKRQIVETTPYKVRIITFFSGILMSLLVERSPQNLSTGYRFRSIFGDNTELVLALMLIVFGIGCVHIFIDYWVNDRLAGSGIILLGQVTSASGSYGKYNFFTFQRPYNVTFHYKVKLPDSRVIEGQETAKRNDFSYLPLPKRGDIVVILYYADEVKLLL